MADYYNPYSPYQPYVPPAPTFYPSLTTPRSATQMPMQNNQNGSPNTFQWVQGQAGAEAYLVAPGASVILMDSNAPVIYFKSADQNGRYLPMKTYDLCEIKEKESMEDTGYSGRMPWTYDDRYYDIHSYKGANGGYGSNGYSMRRDQTGRYSREGAKEHMIDGLYSMMGDAQNEAERGAIQDCINRLKS